MSKKLEVQDLSSEIKYIDSNPKLYFLATARCKDEYNRTSNLGERE